MPLMPLWSASVSRICLDRIKSGLVKESMLDIVASLQRKDACALAHAAQHVCKCLEGCLDPLLLAQNLPHSSLAGLAFASGC